MPKRKRKKVDRSKNDVKASKGVCKTKTKSGRFQVQITMDDLVDDKSQHLGIFDTPKEAAQAHHVAAIQAGHPTSTMNFLDFVNDYYNKDAENKSKPKKKKKLSSNQASNTTIGFKRARFRGVYKQGKRFKAQIYLDGTSRYLGIFDTIKEAAIAYDLAAIQAKRRTSDLNFLELDVNATLNFVSQLRKNYKQLKMKKNCTLAP